MRQQLAKLLKTATNTRFVSVIIGYFKTNLYLELLSWFGLALGLWLGIEGQCLLKLRVSRLLICYLYWILEFRFLPITILKFAVSPSRYLFQVFYLI